MSWRRMGASRDRRDTHAMRQECNYYVMRTAGHPEGAICKLC